MSDTCLFGRVGAALPPFDATSSRSIPREERTAGTGAAKNRELTGESAIPVCGVYVDLNQIRAGEARTPREAQHSSIAMRLAEPDVGGETAGAWLAPLSLAADQLGDLPSASGRRASDKGFLSMTLDEYTRILMWTAAQGDGPSGAPMPDGMEKQLWDLDVLRSCQPKVQS